MSRLLNVGKRRLTITTYSNHQQKKIENIYNSASFSTIVLTRRMRSKNLQMSTFSEAAVCRYSKK